MTQKKLEKLLEPIQRLVQFADEMHLLGEIQDKILAADISEVSPIEEVQLATIEAMNRLGGTIRVLSGEILEELKL